MFEGRSDTTEQPRLVSECGVEIALDVGRYCAAPARSERRFLKRLTGPILDVGCGPGRAAAYLRHRGLARSGFLLCSDGFFNADFNLGSHCLPSFVSFINHIPMQPSLSGISGH